MKAIFKIVSVFVIITNLMVTVSYADATKDDTRHASSVKRNLSSSKDIICDDFAMGGDDVTNYGYKTTVGKDSSVTISQTLNETGKMQKMLKLSDRVPGTSNSGAKIQKKIGKFNSGKIGFEMKFKMEIPEGAETDFASMELNFLTEKGEKATRFYVLGNTNGGSIRWAHYDSGGTKITDKIQPGEWYKLKLILNFDLERVTVYLESDTIEVGSWMSDSLRFMDVVQETDDWVITDFSFESKMFTADWYIDYIKVVKDPDFIKREKFYRPEPIPIPVSPVFNERVIPDKINVQKDGAYKYFSNIEKDDDGNVFADVTSALRSFGCTINISDGKYTGRSAEAEIIINADGSQMTINGVSVSDCVYKNADGKLMVLLNGVAKTLDYKVEWHEYENTLYISR